MPLINKLVYPASQFPAFQGSSGFAQPPRYPQLPRRRRLTHHPSTITRCMRQQYYEWTGEKGDEQPLPAKAIDAMGASSAMEGWVRERYTRQGIRTVPQVRVSDDSLPMSGSVDWTAEIDVGVERPVELKSLNCTGFKRNVRSLDDGYYYQLQAYLHMGEWPWGIFHIFGKCDSLHHFWFVEADGEAWSTIVKRCETINKCVLTEISPAREEQPVFGADGRPTEESSWDCRECSYYKSCARDG